MNNIGNDANVLVEIAAEVRRRGLRWGEQDYPDGTGPDVDFGWSFMREAAFAARSDRLAALGEPDDEFAQVFAWRHIMLDKVFEALAEEDPAALRAGLIQVAAVAARWVAAIDRRGSIK